MKPFRYLILPLYFLLFPDKPVFSQTAEKTDTAVILEMIRKGGELRDSEPEKSLRLINEALANSRETAFTKGMVLAYARLGRWYFGSNIDTSVLFARRALALLEKERNLTEEKADMHLLLAEAYDEQGRTDSSAFYYYLLGDEAESGAGMRPEFSMEIYTKLAIFWINLLEGNYKDEKISSTIRGYIQKARELAGRIKDTGSAVASIYFLQGIYYHGIREFDSARHYYSGLLQAKGTIKKPNLLRRISILTNMVDTYLQQQRPAEAMPYISQVKELGNDPSQKNYLSFFMAFTGLLEGKALYQLKQYPAAIRVLQESLEKLNATGGHLRAEVVEAYQNLAASYEAMGNYPQALANKNIYISLNDSLSRKTKLDMISRQEIRFRIAQKDKELVEQQLTIARANNKIKTKNAVIGGIAALILILGLLLVMWRRRNIHKHKIQRQQIENLQQKMKIERLNAMIAGEEKERTRIARELHDGIGGLLTAAKMNFELVKTIPANEHQPDFHQGLKLLGEANAELRQAARNLMPEILLKEGLSSALRAFCERVSEKSGTQIRFQEIGTNSITEPGLELSVYRILQELVHNIVKHAQARTALVQISFEPGGGLHISVEDDGIGMSKTVLQRQSGMGMKNIRERVAETGGKLDIRTEEGKGTSVYIEYETPAQPDL